jgi:hypothetical protein
VTSAGHPGTPPAKKIGVRPGHRIVLVHPPDGWTIPGLPPDVTVTAGTEPAGADIVVAFFRARAELAAEGPALARALPRGSVLWVAWPRRAGGHTSDITDRDLRDVLLPTGVVDVKVAALDADWSGLRFGWRRVSGAGRAP